MIVQKAYILVDNSSKEKLYLRNTELNKFRTTSSPFLATRFSTKERAEEALRHSIFYVDQNFQIEFVKLTIDQIDE